MKTKFFLFLATAFGLTALFFFPQQVKAQDFATIEVNSRIQNASGVMANLRSDVSVYSNQSGSEWYSGSADQCQSCDGHGIVTNSPTSQGSWDRTLSSGNDYTASFGNGVDSGLACGHSGVEHCGNGNGRNCNPFHLTATPYNPSLYDDESYWRVNGHRVNGKVLDHTFNIANDRDYTFNLVFYPHRDTLTANLSANVTDGNLDCIKPAPGVNPDNASVRLSASYTHDSYPTHAVSAYSYDFTNNGSWDTGWVSGDQVHTYTWDEIGGFTGSQTYKDITAKVWVHCAGGKDATKTVTFRLYKSERRQTCSLSATPQSGSIPLDVTLTANVQEGWCLTAPAQYVWNFGDGTPGVNTLTPSTNHTYTTEGSFTPSVDAIIPGADTKVNCPATSAINSKFWSDTKFQEVAP